jgi:hypothetical protein
MMGAVGGTSATGKESMSEFRSMPHSHQWTHQWTTAASGRGWRGLAIVCLVVGLGLALGGCSKCDVPNWSAPRACHDGPAPQ